MEPAGLAQWRCCCHHRPGLEWGGASFHSNLKHTRHRHHTATACVPGGRVDLPARPGLLQLNRQPHFLVECLRPPVRGSACGGGGVPAPRGPEDPRPPQPLGPQRHLHRLPHGRFLLVDRAGIAACLRHLLPHFHHLHQRRRPQSGVRHQWGARGPDSAHHAIRGRLPERVYGRWECHGDSCGSDRGRRSLGGAGHRVEQAAVCGGRGGCQWHPGPSGDELWRGEGRDCEGTFPSTRRAVPIGGHCGGSGWPHLCAGILQYLHVCCNL